MTFSTIMVHLDVGTGNEGVLHATAALAERCNASVIGIAACQPMRVIASDAYMGGDMVGEDLAEIAEEITAAEAGFRTALRGGVGTVKWRSATEREGLADYVVRDAGAADLVITGPDLGWSAFDTSRRLVVGDLVQKLGRPVLIVPTPVTRSTSTSSLWPGRTSGKRDAPSPTQCPC